MCSNISEWSKNDITVDDTIYGWQILIKYVLISYMKKKSGI